MKGVTDGYTRKWVPWLISTHTPVKGVTSGDSAMVVAMIISTHTPVKGVTRNDTQLKNKMPNFNPHTRERCDSRAAQQTAEYLATFQPTHP